VTDPTSLTPQQHRRLGIDLFNDAWRLMEKEDRPADEDALLLATTFASYYHWQRSEPEPVHAARGEWQVSRVYCVLDRPEPALITPSGCWTFARVLDICQANGIGDWDLAVAYEALARAHAIAGRYDEARRSLEQAKLSTVDIAEDDDRDVVLADLETVPLPR
jgi:hypothetical protein